MTGSMKPYCGLVDDAEAIVRQICARDCVPYDPAMLMKCAFPTCGVVARSTDFVVYLRNESGAATAAPRCTEGETLNFCCSLCMEKWINPMYSRTHRKQPEFDIQFLTGPYEKTYAAEHWHDCTMNGSSMPVKMWAGIIGEFYFNPDGSPVVYEALQYHSHFNFLNFMGPHVSFWNIQNAKSGYCPPVIGRPKIDDTSKGGIYVNPAAPLPAAPPPRSAPPLSGSVASAAASSSSTSAVPIPGATIPMAAVPRKGIQQPTPASSGPGPWWDQLKTIDP